MINNKKTLILVMTLAIIFLFSGCNSFDFAQEGGYIVSAKDALEQVKAGGILVDARPADKYQEGHIEGAVSIPMSALVVNEPYANMLPTKEQVEEAMGAFGIKETDVLYVYDDSDNMQAARIQWTLEIYGNKNVKVVSGGFKALLANGGSTSTAENKLAATTYTGAELEKTLITNLAYINLIKKDPKENVILVDTRSAEEYKEGTIPGSVWIEYKNNNYTNGEFKSVRDIRLTYLDQNINPDDRIILFCKTSVRAAQTYAALKNAGFKDVRIYDGAWLEYSDKTDLTQDMVNTVTPSTGDGS